MSYSNFLLRNHDKLKNVFTKIKGMDGKIYNSQNIFYDNHKSTHYTLFMIGFYACIYGYYSL